jgi:hypothetical protein
LLDAPELLEPNRGLKSFTNLPFLLYGIWIVGRMLSTLSFGQCARVGMYMNWCDSGTA